MISRGSLRHCIDATLHAYKVQCYPVLSILHSKTGNYYTAVTEEELSKFKDSPIDGKQRLVFRGSERELKRFCTTRQTDIFTPEIPNG